MRFVALVLGLMAAATTAAQPDSTEIEIGRSFDGRLPADDVQEFQVALDASRSYLLELSQDGLNFVVETETPQGEIRTFDAPLRRLESERILLEPGRAGPHRIRLSSDEYTGAIGTYRLRVSLLERDGAAARQRRDALRSETSAATAYRKGGEEFWGVAVSDYRDAIEQWHRLADRPAEARARLALANILYAELTDWNASMAEARHSAVIYRELGNTSLWASALHLEAAALMEQATQSQEATKARSGESADAMFDRARSMLADAAASKEELGEQYERARIVNDVGLSYYLQGRWDKAATSFEEAATSFAASAEWFDEIKSRLNLSVVGMHQGQLEAAIASFSRALQLIGPDRLPDLRGYTLDNLGLAYRTLGDVDNALSSYLSALDLHEARGELKAQGQSLGNIGITYYVAGDLQQARDYLEDALEMRRRANDGRAQATALRYLGSIYREQGLLDRAIDAHREATQLATSPADRALAQALLAEDFAANGRLTEAMEVLEGSVEAAEAAGVPVTLGTTLAQRGAIYRQLGDAAEANRDLGRAAALFAGLGLDRNEAYARLELARLERDAGRPAGAIREALAAIELIERQRGLITSPDLRASFLGQAQDYYHLVIDLLMARFAETGDPGQLSAAVEASERARARALMDLLNEARVDASRRMKPEFRDRESSLLNQIAGLRYRQERLVAKGAQSGELEAVLAELRRANTELDVLETRIRREDTAYASLRSPEVLDVQGMQRELGPRTVLVQYALGEPRSYAFVLTASSVHGVAIASRSEIETLARLAHEDLKLRDAGRPAYASTAPLSRLAATVLAPIADRLDRERIAVAADGALHYIPFSALPIDTGDGAARPLLWHHEVVTVPSMSALHAHRQQLAGRAPAEKVLAVFADPVFGDGDPRMAAFARNGVAALQYTQEMPRPVRPGATVPRLPATGDEARRIASLVADSETLLATGLAATRERMQGADMESYRYVHIATHGLVDTRYPALSALVLSAFDDEGQPTDGLIRLYDIFNLRLSADAVVLSACDTALGREVRGEGLIGLTRGFMYAGARAVIASLWQVPDQATARLMELHYQGLLDGGMAPAAALRQAQLSLARQGRYQDPYYWASFVSTGEWLGSTP